MSTPLGNENKFVVKPIARFENASDDETVSSSELERAQPPQLNVESRKRNRSEFTVSSSFEEASVAKKPNTSNGGWQNGNVELGVISPPPQLERQDVNSEIADIFNDEGFEEPVYPDLSRLFENFVPGIPAILNHDSEVSAFIPYSLFVDNNRTENNNFGEEKDEPKEVQVDQISTGFDD